MSYVKQNFVDGQTLTAAQLNHMEAGIAATATGVKGDKGEKGDPGPQGPKGDKGDPGEGFTANAKALLLNLFENAAYKTDTMQPTLNALRAEWGGSAQEFPVQSVSLSAVTMTLNESESKTLTATVLPANATDRAVVWSVLPTGFATVANGVVTGIKAGNCTVTATAGGKSASCAVTVEVVETAQLIYSLPGETVQIDENGNIYINGEILEESYGKEIIDAEKTGLADEPITLGDDEYFVLGDNRNNSLDSRDPSVGNVHRDNIIGRAWLRIMPFSEFGVLKHQ